MSDEDRASISSDLSSSMTLKGPLGKRKSVQSRSSIEGPPVKVRFNSQESVDAPTPTTTTPTARRSSVSESGVLRDRRASVINPSSTLGIPRAGRGLKPSDATKAEPLRRLSLWGEQLHERLFANKDIKEVMRDKMKMNLTQDGNSAPQIHHTDINSIADFDEEDKADMLREKFQSDYIESTAFRTFILITIIVNSFFIALQTDKGMEQGLGFMFSAADQLILTIFIFEILVKWYFSFFTYWKVGWNIFDFVIVATSLVGPSFTFVSSSRVLRILRVLRAFRSLRSISALKPLQLVVQTIIQSLPDMANILMLLIMFMFVFAVIGVSFFKDDSPEYFGNLGRAMFSLFICITLDGWIEVFETLRKTNFALGSTYFVVFILIGAFVLINLVVAVVVTNLESAIAEQDELDMQQLQEEKGAHDENEDLRTYDLRAPLTKKFWKHQKPIEIPNLPALNPHKVQNYMIVVCALEDNYADMEFLREELSKITKEVSEWNSPVDEEESAAKGKAGDAAQRESFAKTSKQEKKTSTFANLLHKASLLANSDNAGTTKRSISRKTTITSVAGAAPLDAVTEEDEEEPEEGSPVQDPPPPVMQKPSKGKHRKPKAQLTADDDLRDANIGTKISHTYKSVGPAVPASSHLPASSPRLSTLSTTPDKPSERRGSSVIAGSQSRLDQLKERSASNAGKRKGDVLSDLITMNKKTNNFSGNITNMSQLVHGVNWFTNKVKGGLDTPERKKKWQVTRDEIERKRGGSTSSADGQPLYNPLHRHSITSDNLVQQHLTYLANAENAPPEYQDAGDQEPSGSLDRSRLVPGDLTPHQGATLSPGATLTPIAGGSLATILSEAEDPPDSDNNSETAE